MKLLGIIWNSVSDKDIVTDYIKNYCEVDHYIDVDLKEDFKNFIYDLYPFNEDEKWKAEYKINGLINKYKDNTIRVLFLDVPIDKKIYLNAKNKYMFENVLSLKVNVRKNFGFYANSRNINGVSYDNVYHMTDDEEEYNHDIKVIFKYLKKQLIRKNGFIDLVRYFDISDIKQTSNGTRNSFWFNSNILFKENRIETFESLSEIFIYELMMQCNLNCAYYDLATYNERQGVISFNCAQDDEVFYEMASIIDPYNSMSRKELVLNNNIPNLRNILLEWCNKNSYIYDEKIIDDIKKLYIFDLISFQLDRNPHNYAIVANKNDRTIRLCIYDNSNILIMDNSSLINKYLLGEYIFDDLKNMTFLLFDESKNGFENKIDLFNELYNSSSNEEREYIKKVLRCFSVDNIMNIFKSIENSLNIILPEVFKNITIYNYDYLYSSFNKIILDFDNQYVRRKNI